MELLSSLLPGSASYKINCTHPSGSVFLLKLKLHKENLHKRGKESTFLDLLRNVFSGLTKLPELEGKGSKSASLRAESPRPGQPGGHGCQGR